MDSIQNTLKALLDFRNARDWKQFHKPKDLAISISLEASEILDHFQWKTDAEFEEYLKTHKENVADELADVFNYLLILSHDLDINLLESAKNKLKKNIEKYPVEKAKGNHKKYTEL